MTCPPTQEQSDCISLFRKGESQVVHAEAGSGKTTLLLLASTGSEEPVLILSYNRPLVEELTAKVAEWGLDHVRACTFHGFASLFYGTCPDDISLHSALERPVPEKAAETKICIDEAQDLRPDFVRLVKATLRVEEATFLLVGDTKQLLYDYEDPPADLCFMLRPELHFKPGPWRSTALTTSFRLSPTTTRFVNSVSGTSIRPVRSGETEVRVHRLAAREEAEEVLRTLRRVCKAVPKEEIAILVRSTRPSPGLVFLVNFLAERGVPLYIHGRDGSDERVRKNCVRVSTWHSAKGMQFRAAVVLDVASDSPQCALHVALTRATDSLSVFLTKEDPNEAVLRAAAETLGFEEGGSVPPSPPTWRRRSQRYRHLEHWSPRGRCDSMLSLVVEERRGEPSRYEKLEERVVVPSDDKGFVDMSGACLLASLFGVEREATGRCNRVDDMKAPVHLSYLEWEERVLRTPPDRKRYVLSYRPLLHERVARELYAGGRRADPSLVEAVAALSFSSFHHDSVLKLLAAKQVDERLLCSVRHRISMLLGEKNEFDVLVRGTSSSGQTLLYRADLVVDSVVWKIVYDDEIRPSTVLNACVPLSLDDSLSGAGVLNARTNEKRRLSLLDAVAFREEVAGKGG